MDKKAQVAVEFLTTYGWVLVGVIILLAVLLYYGAFDPMRFVSRQCNFEPGLPCTTYKLESNLTTGGAVYIVQLSNNLGYDISLPNNSIQLNAENVGKAGKQTYVGNCSPRSPTVIKKGQTFTCIVNIPYKEVVPSIGKTVRLDSHISYNNCLTAQNYTTTGDCTAASNYTTTGTAITQMEPYSGILYCGDEICSPSIGENPATCPADCPPASRILVIAAPQTIQADGTNSLVTATLEDRNLNRVPGVPLTFSSTLGTLSAVYGITDGNGQVRVNISSLISGNSLVTVNSPQLTNSTTVTFKSNPSSFSLSVVNPICAGGISAINVIVRDSNGNPMQGLSVTLGHNSSNVNSTLIPTSGTTDSSGMVLSYFENDTTVENLRIQANVSDPNTGQLLNSITKPLLTMDCSAQGGCVPTYDSNGNWIISGDVLCVNVVVPVTGSVIIMPGASLTLRGATVNFTCLSEFSCQNMINGSMRNFGVYVFGTLNLFDDWTGKPSRLTVNTTPFDCCPGDAYCGELYDNVSRGINELIWKIQGCAPKCSLNCMDALPHFDFEAEPGSQVTMYGSIIDHVGRCAWSSSPSGDDGVYIASNNAVVRNMKLTHCCRACIVVMGSGNQITNNTIYNTSLYGIDIWSGGGNNNIAGNEMFGIQGSAILIEDWSSGNTIRNNYIHNNIKGIEVKVAQYQPNNLISSNALMYNSVGVYVNSQRYANLASNVIQFNTGAGVYCEPYATANFNATADFNGDIITRNGADNCSTCKRVTDWNGRGITVGDDCPYP